jgi:hypothetical protein
MYAETPELLIEALNSVDPGCNQDCPGVQQVEEDRNISLFGVTLLSRTVKVEVCGMLEG